MTIYTENDVLKIAKRFNNTKRTYLLVNPLQAKHMPVSPSDALTMMRCLGEKLAAKYPDTKLVIGLAETATAVGAAVAESFSSNCVYVHTTRESVSSVMTWIDFQEEHSHATEQKIAGDNMGSWISGTGTVVIVDDEISTGKTLVNMIEQLKHRFPSMGTKRIVVASLLNRISAENERILEASGITCECLVRLTECDFTVQVENIGIEEATKSTPASHPYRYQALFCDDFGNPRSGVYIKDYIRGCTDVADTFVTQFAYKIAPTSSILVLGTEECMYPALKIGEALEHLGQNFKVCCHATTRSPIGICHAPDYPIFSGYKIKSFYADDRDTYIYNLATYDVVIIVADTKRKDFEALHDLVGALPNSNSCAAYYIQNGRSVWCSEN